MQISAVIITKNEEKNIGRCIESLLDVVDEVIVVDSKSTDKTEGIVRGFPKTQFITTDWMGYAKTKSFANSQAQGPYILSLDADEALNLELRKNIQKIKKDLSGAYSFNRLTNYCGQWIKNCGWYPDKKVRLFHKDEASWSPREVHEDIEVHVHVPVRHIRGDLYHYSYYTYQEHIERANKYSDLAAIQLSKSNKKFLRTRSIVNSFARFLKSYVTQWGFLEGYNGLVISAVSALEVFLKYSKAYQIRNSKKTLSDL